MAAPLGEHRPVVKQKFLESFRRLGTVGGACEQVGIDRAAVYGWLRVDEQFAESFQTARENLADALEASVYTRAFKSDLLAMFYMKKVRPEFRDRLAIDLPAVDEEIRERMERLKIEPRLFATLIDSIPEAPEQENAIDIEPQKLLGAAPDNQAES